MLRGEKVFCNGLLVTQLFEASRELYVEEESRESYVKARKHSLVSLV